MAIAEEGQFSDVEITISRSIKKGNRKCFDWYYHP
jgi:hypothetical protein